jgi:iron complex transport system permease protein
LAVILIGTGTGSVFIPPGEIVSIILSAITGTPTAPDIKASTVGILWSLRLPRVLLAFLAGATLSASGAVMQSVLKNPLASSYTLGVSAGASLGAGLMMIFGFGAAAAAGFTAIAGTLAVPIAGFAFSLLSIAGVMLFSRAIDPRLDNNTIILSGMIFSLFISAMLTLISALAADSMQRLLYWQMGSFAMKGWEAVAILAPVLAVAVTVLMGLSRELDILTFGDDEAASLGVPVRKTKRALIGIASVLTGCTIAFTGVIGFLDLAVPHIVRRIFGPAHRRVIPFCVLFGGVFMVLADLVARTAIPAIDLPVGAVTALAGAPFFAWVYLRSHRGPA